MSTRQCAIVRELTKLAMVSSPAKEVTRGKLVSEGSTESYIIQNTQGLRWYKDGAGNAQCAVVILFPPTLPTPFSQGYVTFIQDGGKGRGGRGERVQEGVGYIISKHAIHIGTLPVT